MLSLMNPDSPLKKFLHQSDPADEEILFPDAVTDSYTPFRSAYRLRRVVLYCSDGTIHAPLYSSMNDVVWEPRGETIKMEFLHANVYVKGRNLQSLGQLLAAEKAAFLQPYDERWPQPEEAQLCIDSITFEGVEPDEGFIA
jgi:hypothetical protein